MQDHKILSDNMQIDSPANDSNDTSSDIMNRKIFVTIPALKFNVRLSEEDEISGSSSQSLPDGKLSFKESLSQARLNSANTTNQKTKQAKSAEGDQKTDRIQRQKRKNSTAETGEDVNSLLDMILQGYPSLSTPEQISPLYSVMLRITEDADIIRIFNILSKCQNRKVMEAFTKHHKAMFTLFNWCIRFLQNESFSLLVLRVIQQLPFDPDIFKDYKFGTIIKKAAKSSSKGMFIFSRDFKISN